MWKSFFPPIHSKLNSFHANHSWRLSTFKINERERIQIHGVGIAGFGKDEIWNAVSFHQTGPQQIFMDPHYWIHNQST